MTKKQKLYSNTLQRRADGRESAKEAFKKAGSGSAERSATAPAANSPVKLYGSAYAYCPAKALVPAHRDLIRKFTDSTVMNTDRWPWFKYYSGGLLGREHWDVRFPAGTDVESLAALMNAVGYKVEMKKVEGMHGLPGENDPWIYIVEGRSGDYEILFQFAAEPPARKLMAYASALYKMGRTLEDIHDTETTTAAYTIDPNSKLGKLVSVTGNYFGGQQITVQYFIPFSEEKYQEWWTKQHENSTIKNEIAKVDNDTATLNNDTAHKDNESADLNQDTAQKNQQTDKIEAKTNFSKLLRIVGYVALGACVLVAGIVAVSKIKKKK